MTRIRQMSADAVESILARYGFELVSQKGSHRKWRNLESKLQVIVPYHKGKSLPIGTQWHSIGLVAPHFQVGVESPKCGFNRRLLVPMMRVVNVSLDSFLT